jgi:nucleotide-binding universal stress UspA family protein
MYKRILLAYDGSVEGRTTLREGALLDKQLGAEVFLLSVLTDTGALLFAEVALAGAAVQIEEKFREILEEGVSRLKKLGLHPAAKLVQGQPGEEIGKYCQGGRRRSHRRGPPSAERLRSLVVWSKGRIPDGLYRLQSLGRP